MTRPHYQEIADARFEREYLARMNEDHMPLADELHEFSRAAQMALVGVTTGILIFLMLLFVAQGPKVIAKISHEIERAQQ
mgnify:CR=1 FL=1